MKLTLEEFKELSLGLVLQYMVSVYQLLGEKNVSVQIKQKLIATALSLLLYAQEELETLSNNSDDSIAD